MARTDRIYSQGRGESGRALPVQCTMTKSSDTTIAHIQGPVIQRPADAWITAAALHFIGVLFCCAACLQVSRALEESPTLHRGPQAQRVNTTTTLMVAPARTQTCSRVQSICRCPPLEVCDICDCVRQRFYGATGDESRPCASW